LQSAFWRRSASVRIHVQFLHFCTTHVGVTFLKSELHRRPWTDFTAEKRRGVARPKQGTSCDHQKRKREKTTSGKRGEENKTTCTVSLPPSLSLIRSLFSRHLSFFLSFWAVRGKPLHHVSAACACGRGRVEGEGPSGLCEAAAS
jgi:hypothetical protein